MCICTVSLCLHILQRRIASLHTRGKCTFLFAYLAKVHRIKSKKIISFNSLLHKSLSGTLLYFEIWDVGENWTQNQQGIDSNTALTWQKKSIRAFTQYVECTSKNVIQRNLGYESGDRWVSLTKNRPNTPCKCTLLDTSCLLNTFNADFSISLFYYFLYSVCLAFLPCVNSGLLLMTLLLHPTTSLINHPPPHVPCWCTLCTPCQSYYCTCLNCESGKSLLGSMLQAWLELLEEA